VIPATINGEKPVSDTDTFEIDITTMAHGGYGIGRHNNRTIFVPYTIPGERLEAEIIQERGRIAFARGLRLIDASVDRVYPRCPHFGPGRCGRCQWQHIAYEAQVLLKQDILADQMSRVGGLEDELIEHAIRTVVPSPQQWGYNYHMTLDVLPDGKVGYPAADDPALTFPIEECHIIHPELLELLYQLDMSELGSVSRMRLQLGTDGAHMIVLSVDAEEDVPELEADLPTSVNLLLPDNEPVNLIGDSHVIYEVQGHRFRVTAGSEFRANVAQLPALVDQVLIGLSLTGDESVLDLYAGVGFFSAFIAAHAGLVTMVESYPPAASDAEENLAEFEHVEIIEGLVEDVLDEFEEGTTYDAAVIDPPSTGLSTEVMDALVALNIPRLVYVSGDPATLARDTQRLLRHGYTLQTLQPIDLSPQTYYIDCVATFSRDVQQTQ
jgi:23S rRNA (uracil1939-C5)-methyltransferase